MMTKKCKTTEQKQQKKVTWHSSTKEPKNKYTKSSTKSFFENPKKRYSWLKKRLYSRMKENELEKFADDLKILQIEEKILTDFVEAEGYNILYQAILLHKNTNLLDFMINNMPTEAIKKILHINDFLLLDNFFSQSERFIQRGWYNEEYKQIKVSILKSLLHIDFEDVAAFVNQNKDHLSENVLKVYKEANENLSLNSTISNININS